MSRSYRSPFTIGDLVEAYATVLHATCPGACPQVLMRCIRALIRRDETSGWWREEA